MQWREDSHTKLEAVIEQQAGGGGTMRSHIYFGISV